MTSNRILVLGASGQLGAQLCQLLGPAALPAARSPQHASWLKLDLQELAEDSRDLSQLLDQQNVSAVICAAGATDVERCESERHWAAAANHEGPAALARAARGLPFVFYSTDYVFDGKAGPYAEDDEPCPLSVYGATKLAGERAILEAHPRALVLRTTTVYGPDPQKKNFLYTLRRLLTEGKSMRVPSDQYANPTYNADLASTTLSLLRSNQTGLFHVAGPEFLPRTAFAYQACSLLDLNPSLIEPVTTAELNQRAARPLLGGLRSDRLFTTLQMRSPAEGILDWQQSLSVSTSSTT